MFDTILSFLLKFVNNYPMKDVTTIWLKDAETTALCGASLSSSLYTIPVDVVLSGPVGAGKTSFVQGFAKSLGILDPVLSPTYALEQTYSTNRGYPLYHLDLYRIAIPRISEALAQSDAHDGIRCIEWADRMSKQDDAGYGTIAIQLEEEEEGRRCTITFDDIHLPSRTEIEQWRDDVMLPEHIARHCDAVAAFALKCGEALSRQGIIFRPLLLQRAAELHDLLRFVDFRTGAEPAGIVNDAKSLAVWEEWKNRYTGLRHEAACAAFLREKHFDALATVIEVHGLQLPSPTRVTLEQKLLFYADKRVNVDCVVSLTERFEDFMHRYSNNILTEEAKIWHQEAKNVEEELFPNGAPF